MTRRGWFQAIAAAAVGQAMPVVPVGMSVMTWTACTEVPAGGSCASAHTHAISPAVPSHTHSISQPYPMDAHRHGG